MRTRAPNWMPEVATPRNTIVVPPGSRCASESPGMYLRDVVDLLQAAHRDVVAVECGDRLGNVLQPLGALGRGDDDLAEAGDRRRLLLRGGRARGYREYRGYGGREGLRARSGSAKDRVSHVLPSAVFRILATGRRPGKPSPVARRMAATYQSRNSWVNDSIDSESGPGS